MLFKIDNTTMKTNLKLLDAVALTIDLPEHQLVTGQVGTIVEVLDTHVFEVEFSDDNGRSYAQVALSEEILIALHYSPVAA
jgi:hypothetical protein|tara:strand:- start:1070 stop:1312 length:243 start_codon:yes stop_codon:yes gene_type:complete